MWCPDGAWQRREPDEVLQAPGWPPVSAFATEGWHAPAAIRSQGYSLSASAVAPVYAEGDEGGGNSSLDIATNTMAIMPSSAHGEMAAQMHPASENAQLRR